MIETADLTRYAGQFVWLQLNFDEATNHMFFAKYGAISTPTFYILEPKTGRVTASQTGAMSLTEFKQFLQRGANGAITKVESPADSAMARGDGLLAKTPEEAVVAYREALRLAPPTWAHRELAQASLAVALQDAGQWQQCAETAASEAAGMRRNSMFARTIVAGMWCVVTPDPAPWTKETAATLEPLAKEALSLPSTVRDHRDELYRTLMDLCLAREDKAGAADWGRRWLNELDHIKPANDEERSAVDIARVENVQTFGDPKRILPALIASEGAMPTSWNASLRVAQMENAAKNYDQAIAACDRGLGGKPGPAGRSWLLQTAADALNNQGQREAARKALEKALMSAETIPNPQTRDNNIKKVKAALEALRQR
jgi:tetratricopeptide (TPR) repeat protein